MRDLEVGYKKSANRRCATADSLSIAEGCQRTGCGRLRAGGRGEGGGGGGRRAQRAARVAGGGGAGVVTQCDVSAPSARYARSPSPVAARSRPPSVAPSAP